MASFAAASFCVQPKIMLNFGQISPGCSGELGLKWLYPEKSVEINQMQDLKQVELTCEEMVQESGVVDLTFLEN